MFNWCNTSISELGAIDVRFQHAIAEIFNFFQSSDHTQDTDMNALAMEKLSGVVKYSKDMLLYAIEQQSVGRSYVTLYTYSGLEYLWSCRLMVFLIVKN